MTDSPATAAPAQSSCCFCDSSARDEIAWPHPDRPVWDLLRCLSCGVMRLRQFPTDEEIRQFYQEQYYRGSDATRFPKPVEWVIRNFRLRRARQAHAILRGEGEVLDIGCGRGLILAELMRLGYTVAGTQLSETAATAIRRQHGIDIFLGELPEANYADQRFRMVLMLHVLEHTTNPAEYLREIYRILQPGGYFLVEVPNAGCRTARTHGLDWLHFDIPHHLYHFDLQNLTNHLKGTGFQVEEVTGFSLEYGPFGILQAWLNRWCGGPRHLLYRTLSGLLPRTSPVFALHLFVAVFLTPAALLLSALRAKTPQHADIITLLCRKPENPRQ